jgi:hypothetical protein
LLDKPKKHSDQLSPPPKPGSAMKNIIIIAAECPQLWNKLHKIRIQKHQEVESDESSSRPTRNEIQEQIEAYLHISSSSSNSSSSINTNTNTDGVSERNIRNIAIISNILIEIYHPDRSFVPLLQNVNNIDDPLEDTFGTRIRCIIHLQQNNHDTNSMTQADDPLLIKGRYFEYNPDGMAFAGTKLIIKEDVNNHEEDGTGLNVWDGSLLLARFLEKNPEKVSIGCIMHIKLSCICISYMYIIYVYHICISYMYTYASCIMHTYVHIYIHNHIYHALTIL